MPNDPRMDLEHLPDLAVFDIARNESAVHRELAIRILIERVSLLAGREESAAEARQLVIDHPAILKRIDPATAVHALKLPGVIDVLSDLQNKRVELTRIVGEHHADHIQNHTALESTVNENKLSSENALRSAYAILWGDYTRKAWQLVEDYNEQKLALDQQIAELHDEHRKDNEVASERLRLLERSPWRKFRIAL